MTDSAGGWPARTVRVGPFAFLLRTPLGAVMRQMDSLYRDYPSAAEDGVPDYTVAVVPDGFLRRWIRPKLRLECDIEIPLMEPMPAHLGLLAFEMGMNLQLAAGMYRYVLLHAASVAQGDRALLLLGDSGAGKSTLSALLAYSGWRFMGDEFALLEPDSCTFLPFPRPISLKNESIGHLARLAPADRFGPVQDGTVKGRIRHLLPPPDAIAAMDQAAAPRLLLLPGFDANAEPGARRMDHSETFVRLTQASPNYDILGERGFEALWRLTDEVPAYALSYRSSEEALALVDRLWAEAKRD